MRTGKAAWRNHPRLPLSVSTLPTLIARLLTFRNSTDGVKFQSPTRRPGNFVRHP